MKRETEAAKSININLDALKWVMGGLRDKNVYNNSNNL